MVPSQVGASGGVVWNPFHAAGKHSIGSQDNVKSTVQIHGSRADLIREQCISMKSIPIC